MLLENLLTNFEKPLYFYNLAPTVIVTTSYNIQLMINKNYFMDDFS
jgi:hypothetical protein